MKLVYVAGRFSAPDRAGVEANIRAAVDVGVEVCKLRAMVCIPHANTSDPRFEILQPYQFWLDGTMLLLRKSDAVMLVSNWRESSGARGEVEEAKRLGIPVFDEMSELKAWLEGFISYDVDDDAVDGVRGHRENEAS